MARATWSGVVAFGLVNVPVKMYVAVEDKKVSFHQINSETGNRVKQPRVDAETGKPVENEKIVKGFSYADATVVVEPQELDALKKGRDRRMEIEKFVEASEIDPLAVRTNHWLVAGKGGGQAYRLLADAMAATGKVGIGRIVQDGREKLIALRERGGSLVASVLVYADEIRAVPDGDVGKPASDTMKDQAVAIIEAMTDAFDHSAYADEYRESVLNLVEQKATGQGIELDGKGVPEADHVTDLMTALEASVESVEVGKPTAKGRKVARKATGDKAI